MARFYRRKSYGRRFKKRRSFKRGGGRNYRGRMMRRRTFRRRGGGRPKYSSPNTVYKSQKIGFIKITLPTDEFNASIYNGGVAPLNPLINQKKIEFSKKDLDQQVADTIGVNHVEYKVLKAHTSWKLDIKGDNTNYYFNETFTGSYINAYRYTVTNLQPDEILQMPYGQKHSRTGGFRMWYPKMLEDRSVRDNSGGQNAVSMPFNHWMANNTLDDTVYGALELILPGVGGIVQNVTSLYVPKWQLQTTVFIAVKGQYRIDTD